MRERCFRAGLYILKLKRRMSSGRLDVDMEEGMQIMQRHLEPLLIKLFVVTYIHFQQYNKTTLVYNFQHNQSQHDELQHFLFVAISTDISTFMSSTSDILHILHYLITLFFLLEIDRSSITYTLG
jgi:hypothetical protein